MAIRLASNALKASENYFASISRLSGIQSSPLFDRMIAAARAFAAEGTHSHNYDRKPSFARS